MDFLLATLFLIWYEALSLPLRAALTPWPAPPDVRRMLSRVAGPALLVLPLWLLAHGSGVFLSHAFGLVWTVLAMGVGVWAGRRHGGSWSVLFAYETERPGSPSRSLAREVALDVFVAAIFFSFIALRRWVPEMTFQVGASGAEKFPNAMIFWSNWYARHLPPRDYWLSGAPLTYYYWGHLHWVWLARMAAFPPEGVINLSLAGVVALVWVSAYLLARAVRLPRVWAALAGLLVTWAGNPSSLEYLLKMGHSWWGSPWGWPWASYEFWGPSRAIKDVVDEFPAFSAILGDFHSHHQALPWLTAWLALTLAGLRWSGSQEPLMHWGNVRPGDPARLMTWASAWIALAVASVLTNFWNLPLFAFGTGLWLLLAARRGRRAFLVCLALSLTLGVTLLLGMHLLRSGAPLPLPSTDRLSLKEKLARYLLPVGLRSSFHDLFALWGFPALIFAAAPLARMSQRPLGKSQGFARLGLVIVGWALVLFYGRLGLPGGPLWVWVGVALWLAALMIGPRPWLALPAGAMLLAGCAILAGLEVVYMPDRFEGSPLARYNSYFKFSYPVWPIFYIGAALLGRRLWRLRPALLTWIRWPARAALGLLLLLCGVYAVCAWPARILMARYGDNPPRRPTLNAFDFTRHRPPYDVEAPMLKWLRERVAPGEVVAEAADDKPYDYGGRVASLGGHPVPIGWHHHEEQWRGPAGYAQIAERGQAVRQIYLEPTPEGMRRLTAALGVQWVLFGINEKELYGERPLAVLRQAAQGEIGWPEDDPKIFLFDFRAPPPKTGKQ